MDLDVRIISLYSNTHSTSNYENNYLSAHRNSDLSFAALQQRRHSLVSNSMTLAVVFRMGSVAEYFIWENW